MKEKFSERKKKYKSYKKGGSGRTMKKKIFLTGVLILLILINLVCLSAHSSKSFNLDMDKVNEIDSKTKYGTYVIEKSEWYDVFGWGKRKVKEITLENNTEVCSNCLSSGIIKLEEDGLLMEDILWKRSFDGGKTFVDWTGFTNWQVYVENKNRYQEVPKYKTICKDTKELSKNGTIIQDCSQVKDGTRTIDTGEWERLDFNKEYSAGTYKWKIEGGKKGSTYLDWIIKTEGQLLDEWAVWGNISEGDDAEVILNSPADGSTNYGGSVIFNASANVTGGAYLMNMSLWTNETGSWGIRNTTNLPNYNATTTPNSSATLFEPVSYYYLDETTGDVIDSVGSNNGTNNGATRGVTGKIENAFDFSAGDYLDASGDFPDDKNTNVTACAWIIPDTLSKGRIVLSRGNNDFGWSLGLKDNKVNMRVETIGSTIDLEVESSEVYTSTWQYICGTYDESTQEIELFINGTSKGTDSGGVSSNPGTNGIRLGKNNFDSDKFVGKMDEVGIWDRALTSNEIETLYNSGNGFRPSETIEIYSETFINTYTSGESILWNYEACDSDGDCGFAQENRTVLIDSIAPTIDIEYPTGAINTILDGEEVDLNFTVSDINLEDCWYEYNGTNTTIPSCENTTFTYVAGLNNITIWANDSLGNEGSDTNTWELLYFVENQNYDEESFITAFNNFSILISTEASSILSPELIYDGETYSASLDIINSTHINLTSQVTNTQNLTGTNNPFYWNISLDETEISTPIFYQNITDINFSLCDASNNVNYLKVDFIDELDLSSINATIRTSTFQYYVEDESAKKTYTYSNSGSNASKYEFCFDPSYQEVIVESQIAYSGDGYPERVYGETLTLSNETTNLTLNLLDDGNGLYATFQFVDSTTNVPLSGVSVEIYDGTDLIIQKLTDDSGKLSEWLNPNILYEVQFEKTDYISGSESHRPVDTSTITIELNAMGFESDPSVANGLTTSFYPSSTQLDNNTFYSFGFYASEGEEEIETMSFRVYDSNLTLIGSGSRSGDGNVSQTSINTLENSTFRVIYEIEGTEGGYWTYYRTYYINFIESKKYSLYWFGQTLNQYFPASERTTVTHLIWYVIWFLCMIGAFTFGYNGSYSSKEDVTRNIDVSTRGDLGIGMFFVFLVTSLFCMFNLIPFTFLFPSNWAWSNQIEQWFLAVISLIALIAITKPTLFNIGRLLNR